MDVTIIARKQTSFTLQVEVPYNDSMLGFEETLQQRLNEAGVVATAEGLKRSCLFSHNLPGERCHVSAGRTGGACGWRSPDSSR